MVLAVPRSAIHPLVIQFPVVLVPWPQRTPHCKIQSEPIYSAEALLAHPLVRKYGIGYILDKLPKTPDSASGCPQPSGEPMGQLCR